MNASVRANTLIDFVIKQVKSQCAIDADKCSVVILQSGFCARCFSTVAAAAYSLQSARVYCSGRHWNAHANICVVGCHILRQPYC